MTDIRAIAAEYKRLWADNPLTDKELGKLSAAADALEVLLQDMMMEDSTLLDALALINHLRGVEE